MKILYKIITYILIIAFLSQNVGWTAPSVSPQSIVNSPQSMVNSPQSIYIPESYGKIEKSMDYGQWTMDSSKSPTVILVKDAHCNYEAQSNIANILDTLIRDYKLDLVCVEGAAGLVDPSKLASIGTSNARKKLSDKYMRTGMLTGADVLSINRGTEPGFTIWGAEDLGLYLKDYQAFRNTINTKEGEHFVKLLHTSIDILKKKIYPDELQKFDSEVTEYEKNETTLTDFINILTQIMELPDKKYPNLETVLESIEIEKSIDFNQVEKERTILIKELEKNLTKEDLRELIKKSLLFKLQKISSLEYYTYLEQYIDPQNQKNLKNYINLAKLQTKIDETILFRELEDLQESIYEKLASDENSVKLHQLDEDIKIISKIIYLEATRDNLLYYKNNHFRLTPEKLLQFIKIQAPLHNIGLAPELNDAEFLKKAEEALIPPHEFYELALKRDKALVCNLLEKMKENNKDIAALVCGGFHAEGINKLLRDENIQTVIVTPSITKSQKDSREIYLARIMDERINPQDMLKRFGLENLAPIEVPGPQGIELLRALIDEWNKSMTGEPIDLPADIEGIQKLIERFFNSNYAKENPSFMNLLEMAAREYGIELRAPETELPDSGSADLSTMLVPEDYRPKTKGVKMRKTVRLPNGTVLEVHTANDIKQLAEKGKCAYTERDIEASEFGDAAKETGRKIEPVIESKLIDELGMRPEEFLTILSQALAIAKGYPGADLALLAKKDNKITVALVDESHCLAGNEVWDGLITLNAYVIELYRKIREEFDDSTAYNFIKYILQHELVHETTGRVKEIEPELSLWDAKKFLEIFGIDTILPVLIFLKKEGVVTPGFAARITNNIIAEYHKSTAVSRGHPNKTQYYEDLIYAFEQGKKDFMVATLKIQNFKREFNDRGKGMKIPETFGTKSIEIIGLLLKKYLDRQLEGMGISVTVYNNDGPEFKVVFHGINPEDKDKAKDTISELLDEDRSGFKGEVIRTIREVMLSITPSTIHEAVHGLLGEDHFGPGNFHLYGGISVRSGTLIETAPSGTDAKELASKINTQSAQAAKYAQLSMSEEYDATLAGLKRIQARDPSTSDPEALRTIDQILKSALASAKTIAGSKMVVYCDEVKEKIELSLGTSIGSEYTVFDPRYNPEKTYRKLLTDLSLAIAESNPEEIERCTTALFDKSIYSDRNVPVFSGLTLFLNQIKYLIKIQPRESISLTFRTGGDEYAKILWNGQSRKMTLMAFDGHNIGATNTQWGPKIGDHVIAHQLRIIQEKESPDDIFREMVSFFNDMGEHSLELTKSEYEQLKTKLGDDTSSYVEEKDGRFMLFKIPDVIASHPVSDKEWESMGKPPCEMLNGIRYIFFKSRPIVSIGIVEINTDLIPYVDRDIDLAPIFNRAFSAAERGKLKIKKYLAHAGDKARLSELREIDFAIESPTFNPRAIPTLERSLLSPINEQIASYVFRTARNSLLAKGQLTDNVPIKSLRLVEGKSLSKNYIGKVLEYDNETQELSGLLPSGKEIFVHTNNLYQDEWDFLEIIRETLEWFKGQGINLANLPDKIDILVVDKSHYLFLRSGNEIYIHKSIGETIISLKQQGKHEQAKGLLRLGLEGAFAQQLRENGEDADYDEVERFNALMVNKEDAQYVHDYLLINGMIDGKSRITESIGFLGKYRQVEKIGEGGMGSVYRAITPLGQPVAIKIGNSRHIDIDTIRKSFHREVHCLLGAEAKKVHGAVRCLDYHTGTTDHDVDYIVTELIEGDNLQSIMNGKGRVKSLTLGEIYKIVFSVADTLAGLHGEEIADGEIVHESIVHRDIKPSNIMITYDYAGRIKGVYVIDFGIALYRSKEVEEELEKTRGTILGTLYYMAPESLQGDYSNYFYGKADVFALGIILHELLTKKHPFGKVTDPSEYITAIQQKNPEFSVPNFISEILELALKKDPQERCSAEEFRRKIEKLRDRTPQDHLELELKYIGPHPNIDPLYAIDRTNPHVIAGEVLPQEPNAIPTQAPMESFKLRQGGEIKKDDLAFTPSLPGQDAASVIRNAIINNVEENNVREYSPTPFYDIQVYLTGKDIETITAAGLTEQDFVRTFEDAILDIGRMDYETEKIPGQIAVAMLASSKYAFYSYPGFIGISKDFLNVLHFLNLPWVGKKEQALKLLQMGLKASLIQQLGYEFDEVQEFENAMGEEAQFIHDLLMVWGIIDPESEIANALPFCGKYRNLKYISEGGMGIIFQGEDEKGEKAAIKARKLNSDRKDDLKSREFFKNEGEVLKSAKDRGIRNIIGFREMVIGDIHPGIDIIATDFVEDGVNLNQLLEDIRNGKRPSLKLGQILEIIEQVLIALEGLHKQLQIVHRDIKLENIIVTFSPDGNLSGVFIIDLGIAAGVGTNVTFKGTSMYMAPEIIASTVPPELIERIPREIPRISQLDGKIDIFSLGIVFYELLTGKYPFNNDAIPGEGRTFFYFTKDEGLTNVLNCILLRDADRTHLSEFPEDVQNVVLGCLEKNPEKRISLDDLIDKVRVLRERDGAANIEYTSLFEPPEDDSPDDYITDTGLFHTQPQLPAPAGLMKRIGKRNPEEDEYIGAELQGRHEEFRKSDPVESTTLGNIISVEDKTIVNIVHTKELKDRNGKNIPSYNFEDNGVVYIVINYDYPNIDSIREEAKIHEAYEAYRLKQFDSNDKHRQVKAHIYASAKQILWAVENGLLDKTAELTPYHLSQIEELQKTDIDKLEEIISEDRSLHRNILSEAGLDHGAMKIIINYEKRLKIFAAVLVIAERLKKYGISLNDTDKGLLINAIQAQEAGYSPEKIDLRELIERGRPEEFFKIAAEIAIPINKMLGSEAKTRGGDVLAVILKEILGKETGGAFELKTLREMFFSKIGAALSAKGISREEIKGDMELIEEGLHIIECDSILDITKIDASYFDLVTLVSDMTGFDKKTIVEAFAVNYLTKQIELIPGGLDVHERSEIAEKIRKNTEFSDLPNKIKRKIDSQEYARIRGIMQKQLADFQGASRIIVEPKSELEFAVKRLEVYDLYDAPSESRFDLSKIDKTLWHLDFSHSYDNRTPYLLNTGNQVFNRYLSALHAVRKDVEGMIGSLRNTPANGALESREKVGIIYHIEDYFEYGDGKVSPKLGLETIFKQMEEGVHVAFTTEGIDDEEKLTKYESALNATGRFGKEIFIGANLAEAKRLLMGKADNNKNRIICVTRDENRAREAKDLGLKSIITTPESEFHVSFLFAVLYAKIGAEPKEGEINPEVKILIENFLGLMGFKKEEIDSVIEEITNNGFYFKVKLIRIGETLRQFQTTKIYIEVAA